MLKADHPALSAHVEKIVRKDSTTKLAPPVSADAEDREVLAQVAAYYHETLKQSPEALRYLESRGLTHPDMIDRFKLGFSNRTLGYRLPDKNRKSGAEIRGRLQRLGLLRESGHEHFTGSVVFPIFDLNGHVTEMYGRKITPGLRTGTPLHAYLPGAHKGVWNEEALVASKEIILCESIIDALTFWCAGFRNVTASYGVNGFTDDRREAFQNHGIEQIWIAYDRDEAGDIAAERLKCREQSMHGNPWFRLLRREVEALVKERHGDTYLKDRQAMTELARINRELKRLKGQMAALEERKAKLFADSHK